MKTLPKQCDICKEPIGLYHPFYTLICEGRFLKGRKPNEQMVLCPECFRQYKDFLNSREEYYIYKNAKAI